MRTKENVLLNYFQFFFGKSEFVLGKQIRDLFHQRVPTCTRFCGRGKGLQAEVMFSKSCALSAAERNSATGILYEKT